MGKQIEFKLIITTDDFGRFLNAELLKDEDVLLRNLSEKDVKKLELPALLLEKLIAYSEDV